MTDYEGFAEAVPTWALRTELPTLVRETCTSAQEIAVWLAIRALLGNAKRRPLTSREIAETAKVNIKTVSPTIEHLVEHDLVRVVGFVLTPNLTGRDGQQKRTPILQIPSRIEEENVAFTRAWLWRNGEPPDLPPVNADQLALDLSDPKTVQSDSLSVPKTDQGAGWGASLDGLSDPKTVQSDGASVPKTDQGAGARAPEPTESYGRSDPKTVQGGVALHDSRVPEEEERRRKKNHDHAAHLSSLPSPPTDRAALTEPPLTLWRQANPEHQPIDAAVLAQLAAEHDAATGGCGAHWVGEAILAAAISSRRGVTLATIKNILTRWQRDGYGTDTPAYQRGAIHGRVNSARDGRDRPRRADRPPDRRNPPAGGDAAREHPAAHQPDEAAPVAADRAVGAPAPARPVPRLRPASERC